MTRAQKIETWFIGATLAISAGIIAYRIAIGFAMPEHFV